MRRLLTGSLVICSLLAAAPAHAQRVTPARDTTTTPAQDTTKHYLSPGKAFLRSVLIPGWGQFSVGAPRRGVVFVTLQSASWYMLVKTLKKVSEANDFADAHLKTATPIVTDTLRAMMTRDTSLNRRWSNPDTFQVALLNALDTTSIVRSARALVNSRNEQRQDWITYTLFLTLASGVDAFIAAHLADFPATITPRRNGAYQLKFTLPAPRRP